MPLIQMSIIESMETCLVICINQLTSFKSIKGRMEMRIKILLYVLIVVFFFPGKLCIFYFNSIAGICIGDVNT